MKIKIYYSMTATIILYLVIFLIGCGSQPKAPEEKKTEPVEVKRTLVTDPNGVMLTINGIDVTKRELDEAIESAKPPENYKYYMAIFTYFIPEIAFKHEFEKEKKQLMDEVNGIMAKVKSGEITFEDAIKKYGDYPGDDSQIPGQKGYFKDVGATQFFNLDKLVYSMKEGEYSEPFFTLYGINVIRLDKKHKDYYGKLFSNDYWHFLITFERFLEKGKGIDVYYNEKMAAVKIKVLDDSFAKQFPEMYTWGLQGEEGKKAQEKLDKMKEPDRDWKTLPPDTPLFSLNGTNVKRKELEDISNEVILPTRDLYNNAIRRQFLQSCAVKGFLKDYHKQIFKELNDIKAEIEKGSITFEDAQQKYSTDPGKTQNGGLYKGIKKGQFVKEFEDVALKIPLNQISEPFLSQFGGHILKVESETKDKDGKRESVDVRHILLSFDKYYKKEKGDTSDQQQTQDPMQEIFQEAMKNLNVVIHDEYIYSILPDLGKPPLPPQPVEEKEEEKAEGEKG